LFLALRFSLIDLFQDRGRSLLSVIGLAVVVFSFMLLAALAEAFSSYLQNTTLSHNLVVVRANVFDPAEDRLDPQVIEAAQAFGSNEISQVAPLVFRHTRLNGRMVQLRAANMDTWQPVFHIELTKGEWPSAPDEILIGEGLAQLNHLDLASKTEIFGREFTISGIFRAPGAIFASVWMPLETAWDVFGTERGYQALFIQVANGADPLAVKNRLENDPHLRGEYAVYLEDNYTRQNLDRVRDLSDMMEVVSLLALLGIVFGVSNTVTLSIVERSHDLGILLGIGFSTRSLAHFIWVRFLILGLLAYVLGAAFAIFYALSQQAFAPFYILEFPLVLQITPAILLTGLFWVVILSLAGTWLATWGFARQRVMELIRAI